MMTRRIVLSILLHAVTSIGLGYSLLFLVLSGERPPWEAWIAQVGQVGFNIGRYPHGFFVAATIACVLLIPMRAGLAEGLRPGMSTASRSWGTVLTAIAVPFLYYLAAQMLLARFGSEMSTMARLTAGTFNAFIIALWAAISVPITLATSAWLARRRGRSG